MRQEIANISCRKIHETNIGHEARKLQKSQAGKKHEKKHRPRGKKVQTSHAGKHMK